MFDFLHLVETGDNCHISTRWRSALAPTYDLYRLVVRMVTIKMKVNRKFISSENIQKSKEL